MAGYDLQSIIRYVDGELSAEEQSSFEAALMSDPALADEVNQYRQLKAALEDRLPEDPVRDALIQRTTELNARYFTQERSSPSGTEPKPAVRKLPTLRWLTTAAAAACIIGAAILLWPERSPRLEDIGETEMIGTAERGVQSDSLLQKAAILFNQQKFTGALPLLNQAVAADSSSMLALFYRGIAAWHTGDPELARTSMLRVYRSGSVLKSDAAFYLSLIYASERNKAPARAWLDSIPTVDYKMLKVKELKEYLK